MKVGHGDKVSLNRHRRRHSQTGDDFGNKLSVERIMKQAPFRLVVSIANQQARRLVTRVEGHAVSRVELLQTVSLRPEVRQVFSGPVELEDLVACITVCQEDVPVLSHRDRRWVKLLPV